MRVATGTAGHDLAAGNADMHLKCARDVIAEFGNGFMDVMRRSHRPFRIVGMGEWCAEHRHDVVAHMFVDAAAVALDDLVHDPEIAVEESVGCFGAEVV